MGGEFSCHPVSTQPDTRPDYSQVPHRVLQRVMIQTLPRFSEKYSDDPIRSQDVSLPGNPCVTKLVLPMYPQAGNTQVTYQFGGDLTHYKFGGVLSQHLFSVTQLVCLHQIFYTAIRTQKVTDVLYISIRFDPDRSPTSPSSSDTP